MARIFNDASSQYLSNANAVLTAYPFTMACWGRSDDTTVTQVLMTIADTAADNAWQLNMSGAIAGDPVSFRSSVSGTGVRADTTTGYSANTWHHCCAIGTSATSRTVYIDGGSAGANTTNQTPAGLDATRIGASGLAAFFMSGHIAEAAIWNVALTAAEVTVLAKGVSPLFIRRQNLVAYWPLYGLHSPETDFSGNNRVMTLNNGPTRGNHPPVVPMKWARSSGMPFIPPSVVASLRTYRTLMGVGA